MKLLNGRKGERILVSTAEEGCKYADGQLFALLWAGVISRSKGECSACGKEAACARQPGRSVNYCQSCWGAEMNRRRDLSKTGKIFLKTYPWPKQKERARIELRLRPGVTLEELLVPKLSDSTHFSENEGRPDASFDGRESRVSSEGCTGVISLPKGRKDPEPRR